MSGAQEPLRILVIDDDEVDRMAIRRLLQRGSLEVVVTEAFDVTTGLVTLECERFDCALVDQRLPDGEGLTVIRRARESSISMPPMILLTMLEDESIGVRALQEGAQDYLYKGRVDASRLARAVRYAVERSRLEDQLRHSQKLEAVGRLSGAVAHDFNNLLSVISSYTQLLAGKEHDEDSTRWLGEVKGAVELATGVVRQLLAFGRRQQLHTERIDLRTTAAEVGRMVERLLGCSIEFEIHTNETPANTIVDPWQIKQVVMNLLVNARDAMPDGGTLRLEVDVADSEDAAVSDGTTISAGRYVVLSVADTGTGIDDTTLARMFEPFFTTKPQDKGTGLGLSTVHGIVTQSRGHIDVDSTVGKGTTFRIYLPHEAAPAVTPPPKPVPHAHSTTPAC